MQTVSNCPRCGGGSCGIVPETEVFDMSEDDFQGEEIYSCVACYTCGFQSKLGTNIDGIIDEWNSPNRVIIEKVRKKNEKTFIVRDTK